MQFGTGVSAASWSYNAVELGHRHNTWPTSMFDALHPGERGNVGNTCAICFPERLNHRKCHHTLKIICHRALQLSWNWRRSSVKCSGACSGVMYKILKHFNISALAGAGSGCEKPIAGAGTGTVFHVLQRAPANQLRPCCKKRGRSYMGGGPVLFGIWIAIIPFACR